MKFEELETQIIEIKREHRAVCYYKNRHWLGTWKKEYSEAYDDAEGHRNAKPQNRNHDVRIIERVYREKKARG